MALTRSLQKVRSLCQGQRIAYHYSWLLKGSIKNKPAKICKWIWPTFSTFGQGQKSNIKFYLPMHKYGISVAPWISSWCCSQILTLFGQRFCSEGHWVKVKPHIWKLISPWRTTCHIPNVNTNFLQYYLRLMSNVTEKICQKCIVQCRHVTKPRSKVNGQKYAINCI